MTRAEHLQWAKDRAVQYVAAGDVAQAWTSMVSDLRKHDELCDHAAIMLGSQLFFAGHLGTPEKMREFILGFN